MLSEELFKLKAARSPRLGGEAEGNDVHVWRVSLGGFETHSPLGAVSLAAARGGPPPAALTFEPPPAGPARAGRPLPRLRR